MTTCSYSIEGGDYEHAGTASRSLKELLKTVGVNAQSVRRVMIAAMARAMLKQARIDQLAKEQPGRDCGLCGAPSCRAFAEDVVLDRTPARACLFMDWTKEGLA